MKKIFKFFLQHYLKWITKLALLINRPFIIVIAGSANKTFVKDEIVKKLKEADFKTGSNPKGFNTEIGLPLAILDLPSGYNSYNNWMPAIIKAPTKIFRKNFPKIFVLELGISDPGDIKYLLSIIKPKIAVLTDITQRYLENFGSMDELAGEYEYLVKKIKRDGYLILNYDNLRVKTMVKMAQAKIITFGLKDGADWQAFDIERKNDGQLVKIKYQNNIKQYKISKFGEHHIYSLLAGLIISHVAQKEKF